MLYCVCTVLACVEYPYLTLEVHGNLEACVGLLIRIVTLTGLLVKDGHELDVFPIGVESGFKGIDRGCGHNMRGQLVPVVDCSDSQVGSSFPRHRSWLVQLQVVTSSVPGSGQLQARVHIQGAM